MPLGAWPYAMALASARDEANPGTSSLYWGNPARALNAVRSGLQTRDDGGSLADRMLHDAARIDDEALIAPLSIDPADSHPWKIVRDLREIMSQPH